MHENVVHSHTRKYLCTGNTNFKTMVKQELVQSDIVSNINIGSRVNIICIKVSHPLLIL